MIKENSFDAILREKGRSWKVICSLNSTMEESLKMSLSSYRL